MQPTIALIHSPLVGPMTWAPVSQVLRARGVETVVPVLRDVEGSAAPYWAQHAGAVAERLERIPAGRALVLVGHSGAGPLLPAIAAFSPHPVAGFIFVDAGLPLEGRSHLEDMELNAPELVAELRSELVGGGRFPQWTDGDLQDIIPGAGLRYGVLAKLHPRPLAYFEERFPPFPDDPEAIHGYIRFSEAYAGPAEAARRSGWAYREFRAGHFHMLVDPEAVAEAIWDLAREQLA